MDRLNHPGRPTAGPLYGNASTPLLEFDLAPQKLTLHEGRAARPGVQ